MNKKFHTRNAQINDDGPCSAYVEDNTENSNGITEEEEESAGESLENVQVFDLIDQCQDQGRSTRRSCNLLKWNQVLTISGSNSSMNQSRRRWKKGEKCLTWILAAGIVIVVSSLALGIKHAFQEEDLEKGEEVFSGNTSVEEDAPITKPPDPTIILYDETILKTTTTETVTTKATIALRKKIVKTRECFTFQGVSCVFPFKYAGSWHHRCVPRGGGAWCATDVTSGGYYQTYGYCDSKRCAHMPWD